VTALLALHLFAIPGYALVQGNSLPQAMTEALPVLVTLALARFEPLGRTGRACAAALGLMVCSGMVVHLSNGLTEAHFHFFVIIPVIAMYEAWAPFMVGVAYVLVHHGVMGAIDPRLVYNHPPAWDRPWLFAGIHAAFFSAACVACIVNWWMHERARHAEGRLVATLAHHAEHDGLTGLPNRAAFLAQSPVRRPGASLADRPTSVLMLDLDRFKEVNDTLGHTFGDQLLLQVSARLSETTRPEDLLARLGGDEFAVLLPETTAEDARRVAARMRASLQQEFLIDGMLLGVDVSIGVTTHRARGVGDATGPDVSALLRQADVAMYEAKRARTGVACYDAGTDDHTRERLSLLTDLRRALERDELVLHYQPKMSVTGHDVVGVEALVRWEHPEHGLLPPASFIPAAEHTALITPLTLRVLEVALAQVRHWRARGHHVPVAVNISPRCLLEPEFGQQVLARLAEAGLPADLLRLEITESTLLADPVRARAALETLADVGVRLSIDDFGTGYSSMSYLRHLPIDELKIDRSFVSGMLDHREDAVLVQSAIDLGHNLGLAVVAEGVETVGVLSALVTHGCDTVQGYLLSRPLPAAALEAWLDEHAAAGARSAPALTAEHTVARGPQLSTPVP